jgi:hypothetical protein
MKTDSDTQGRMVEGREAFRRFDATIGKILSVSHAELLRREKQYKRRAALNPHKRGPKPKVKSVS